MAGFLLEILLISSPLPSQTRIQWRGDVGLRYFSQPLFLSSSAPWRYFQGVADLELSGFIWDPRFLEFELGGNLIYTQNGGSRKNADYRYLGYRVETRFFPRGKFNFGLRFLRNDMGTTRGSPAGSSLQYAVREKGFNLAMSRVRYLPSVRLAYVDRTYNSVLSDSANEEQSKHLNLGVEQSVGISAFSLSYRRERYENQTVERDRSHDILRATERLQVGKDTIVWFDGVLTKNSLAVPSGGSFRNSNSQLMANALSRMSERLQASLRYSYVFNTVDGRQQSLHSVMAGLNYSITNNLILSPLFSYVRRGVDGPQGSDEAQEGRAGARLTWNQKWKALSWRTHLELVYRRKSSRMQGRDMDLAQSFGASLAVGDIRSALGSLGYGYSRADAEFIVPEYGDPSFYYGFGTSLKRHTLRLELKSRLLHPLDTYLYSRYDDYEREIYGQGLLKSTTGNQGVKLGWGGLAVSADYGRSDLVTGGTTARYASLNSTLDFKASQNLDFRVQFTQWTRTDVVLGRDYHKNVTVFINYQLARFTASLIYQNLAWELDGPRKREEILSVTLARSFGTGR